MKKTVVLIHGAFGGAWTMDNFARLFMEHGWDCHTPSLRFHDLDSSADPDPRLGETSIEDYTDDLAEFVRKFDTRPILVGHSMGGVIAQKLAARGLAEAIVLLNSSTVWGILPSTDDERAVGTGLMSAGPFQDTIIRLEFDLMANLALNTMDPAAQRNVFARLGSESGRAMFELFFWMFDDRRTTEVDFDKVDCPVLVVSGNQDRGVSPLTAHKIADKYSDNANFYEADGHGHYLMLEPGWKEVARHCEAWMSSHVDDVR
jgi:non-heme chloroperoxidase